MAKLCPLVYTKQWGIDRLRDSLRQAKGFEKIKFAYLLIRWMIIGRDLTVTIKPGFTTLTVKIDRSGKSHRL